MGLIERLFAVIFGSGRNIVAETAEVFRENTEAGAQRDAFYRAAVLHEFAAEFAHPRRGWFDRLIDGLNRLPRPALALGTLGLFVMAMTDPVWFSARMQGLALVPEPMWWLMGAVVSFYFGARHQLKSQEFQRSIADTMARAPDVVRNIGTLRDLHAATPGTADPGPDTRAVETAIAADDNPALDEWRQLQGVAG